MRKLLAAKGPLDFAAVLDGVQPAGKYAVRSALAKDRERKVVGFRDGLYSLVEKK